MLNKYFTIFDLDIISIILFIILLIWYPDVNINDLLARSNITTSFQVTLILFILVIISIFVYCHISKIIGGILFIVISIFLNTHFKYIEAFTNDTLTSNDELFSVTNYLLKQIEADPNKTQLEKEVINDITTKYFINSDKLNTLTKFNNISNTYSLIDES
jgi:hypothetical protein